MSYIIESRLWANDNTLVLANNGRWKRWDNIDMKTEARRFDTEAEAKAEAALRQLNNTRKVVVVNV